jgi:hypothetical protein
MITDSAVLDELSDLVNEVEGLASYVLRKLHEVQAGDEPEPGAALENILDRLAEMIGKRPEDIAPEVLGDVTFVERFSHACSHCDATDVVGPFEMDGIVDGEYRPRGEYWIVCRVCNRSTHVPQS